MDYRYLEIEKKWRKYWSDHSTNKVEIDHSKPKYYVLDMFPYPSGAGLHVGHPLGYIATDIIARYKKLHGFNVLHPMGYDSFGLPAEQYAIQTGQHPAITTDKNISRYREQLDKLGFSYDWSREVRTSDPSYYKWTQWIFKEFFNAFYDSSIQKARPISELILHFESFGSQNITAYTDYDGGFTNIEWNAFGNEEKENVLQNYRLAFLSDTWVNWCPKLGTVLANDEIVNGQSTRGGHPVEQKKMKQWSMRIKAYAERLIEGLNHIDWSDSIKEQQRNWIGKSEGASLEFEIEGFQNEKIEVFTTRPDTIFGVSFMVLAPEHPLVSKITSKEFESVVGEYQVKTAKKSERERQSEAKNYSGTFTGAYAVHPFTKKKIPIWIGDYVLASYGTGAVMAVPAGDQRDFDFAQQFDLEIPPIFKSADITKNAFSEKNGILINSSFLNDMGYEEATSRILIEIENQKIGKRKINYRLRDAVFSRQRYWGEPFPIFYKDNIPFCLEIEEMPVELPRIDAFLPTETGEPPLARAKKEDWNIHKGDRMEFNTMPGWAGSSWYFLRYLDPKCKDELAGKESVDYWQNVDLYVGGNEHATGHLLYARFWSKFLFDLGHIPFDEPFKKLINQGMILGRSNFAYRIQNSNTYVSLNKKNDFETIPIHVDIDLVDNDKLNLKAFTAWLPEYKNAEFILEDDGTYLCGHEVEKMSKSKFNVQTPDDLIEKFGADTLRMYEMFLGPIEQSKPWDTKGITGVHGFLKKYWRLFHLNGSFVVSNQNPQKEALRILHKTIKKVQEDIDRFSLNTVVSTLMIAVNELTDLKCNNAEILKELTIILFPFAPHIAEEIWEKIGEKTGTISSANFPLLNEEYLEIESYDYPVSFNGKFRFKYTLDVNLDISQIEKEVLALPDTQKWLEGKTPKKIIIVPQKIVNFVL